MREDAIVKFKQGLRGALRREVVELWQAQDIRHCSEASLSRIPEDFLIRPGLDRCCRVPSV